MKISAVIPIYNDANFINLCLESIVDSVDEVIFVDGSPNGASKDEPESVINKKFPKEKIKFIYGTYGKDGKWDRKSQVSAGYNEATCDYIMTFSVDMILTNAYVLKNLPDKYDEVWVNAFDFWMDTNYMRVENENPTKLVCLCSSRKSIDDTKLFYSDKPKIFLHNSSRYHFGWIRPFGQQIAKHVRHIKEGAWGDLGKEVNKLGDRAIEAWAIHHVLRYDRSSKVQVSNLAGTISLSEMNYLDGYKEYQKEYEERYNEDFFVGISKYIPSNLIV